MASGRLGTGLPFRLGTIESAGTTTFAFGQAQATIRLRRFALGQAQARILHTYTQSAQAQALIVVTGRNAFGQAQASIVYKRWAFAQAQALIIHGSPGPDPGPFPAPPPEYIVVFNGFQLFGYAQSESVKTEMQDDDLMGFDWDGSETQQSNLTNPILSMDFLIYTVGWRKAKDQLHHTERILLSSRDERKPLYVDYTDRHYLASFKTIKYQKDITGSRNTLPYTVEFEIDPQMVADNPRIITGAGTIVTTGRTFANGGWTPTILTVTGTDVTVSGYTDTEFTGFVSASGVVAGLVIDTASMTAEMAGNNAVGLLKSVNFELFVGPGETTFEVTGASSISIKYFDRWY